jgi:hypothetical protein
MNHYHAATIIDELYTYAFISLGENSRVELVPSAQAYDRKDASLR